MPFDFGVKFYVLTLVLLVHKSFAIVKVNIKIEITMRYDMNAISPIVLRTMIGNKQMP